MVAIQGETNLINQLLLESAKLLAIAILTFTAYYISNKIKNRINGHSVEIQIGEKVMVRRYIPVSRRNSDSTPEWIGPYIVWKRHKIDQNVYVLSTSAENSREDCLYAHINHMIRFDPQLHEVNIPPNAETVDPWPDHLSSSEEANSSGDHHSYEEDNSYIIGDTYEVLTHYCHQIINNYKFN